MTPIAIPEPSLSPRALLCSLPISMWSARKHDPYASQEIAQRHGAQADAGRCHKVLLPKEALAENQSQLTESGVFGLQVRRAVGAHRDGEEPHRSRTR